MWILAINSRGLSSLSATPNHANLKTIDFEMTLLTTGQTLGWIAAELPVLQTADRGAPLHLEAVVAEVGDNVSAADGVSAPRRSGGGRNLARVLAVHPCFVNVMTSWVLVHHNEHHLPWCGLKLQNTLPFQRNQALQFLRFGNGMPLLC